MNERTRTGIDILQVAAVVGILGDMLLRATPWGLNVLLFNLAFVAGVVMLLRRRPPQYLTRQTWALLVAQIFFAALFVWRSSMELRFADTLAIIAILSVLLVPRMKIAASVAGVVHYFIAFLWSSFNAFLAPAMLIMTDIEWKIAPKSAFTKHIYAVLKGVAIGAPLIVIFGTLFVAADATYQDLVQRAINIDLSTAFTHVLLFSIFGWLSAGYLRGLVISTAVAGDAIINKPATHGSKMDQVRAEAGEEPQVLPSNRSVVEHINISDPPHSETPKQPAETKKSQWPIIDNLFLSSPFRLGSVEVGVILGLTNLLFLSFVIVQIPYLFGGMDLVQNTPDFKLAEYARRGFGELVAVSALVLPMLLIGHWLIRKEDPFAEKLFRVLAGLQIVLLFVIMASAAQRLVLLTGNLGYGLTTIRLYPMIFMAWLAVVFIWFAFTVLRGNRRYFAWCALWSAFIVLAITHVLDPNAFIIKTNLVLMREGRPFDALYNARLGDDAIPTLAASLQELNAADREIVVRQLSKGICEDQGTTDLRSWSISRSIAANTLRNSALTNQMLNCGAGPPFPGDVPAER
jgi:hypothetical protein